MPTRLRILVAGGGIISRAGEIGARRSTEPTRTGGGRLGLVAAVVRLAGGMKYGAAAQAVRRLAAGLAKDAAKVQFVENMRRRLGQVRERKHP